MTKRIGPSRNVSELFNAICRLVNSSRASIALSVNQQLTLLYWSIGKLIKTEVLRDKRAEYGKQVISSLSKKLTYEFGKGWSKQQLWNCLYAVETFKTHKIISTLSGELSWSHIKELIYIKDDLQREFYLQMCRNERWSVRQLRERISSMLYERTALSKKPGKLIKEELNALKKGDLLLPNYISVIPTCLISLVCRTPTAKKTWKLPSLPNYNVL